MGDATRVLLVEDDPNIVDLVRSNLVVRGYDVDALTTGDGAAGRVRDLRPDIVLLDLMLPGVDGFEVCRAIREQSAVGIIVVSARGGEGDKVRALNLGADDYMTKPFVRVHLTPTEFSLLRELAQHPGTLLGHAQLLRRVWGPGYERETEYLRVYVRRLRAKLESGGGPPLIVTEPRLGYRFEPP